jgi:SAM-dependent methyltransferase
MTEKGDAPNDQLRVFYDRHYYADVARSEVCWHLRRMARRSLFGAGQRVLDVACGTGDWLQAAADQGAWVSGVDIASKAVAMAKRKLPTGGFVEGSAEHLPFDDATFDLVSCLGALEHFADKPAALGEMRRVLRKGGKALVLVPNAGFLTRRLGLFRGTEQIAVREDVLSLDAWRRLFEQSGFTVDHRWRDLHVLSTGWLLRKGWLHVVPRLLQALLLTVWPLGLQYQVYHLLVPAAGEQ